MKMGFDLEPTLGFKLKLMLRQVQLSSFTQIKPAKINLSLFGRFPY